MTPELVAAYTAALIALLTALGAFMVQWKTASTLKEVNAKQDVQLGQQAQQTEKLEEVHQLTNSRLSEIEAQLKTAQLELKQALLAATRAESTRATLAGETAARLDRAEEAGKE